MNTPATPTKAGIHWPTEFRRPWKLGTLALGIALLWVSSDVPPFSVAPGFRVRG